MYLSIVVPKIVRGRLTSRGRSRFRVRVSIRVRVRFIVVNVFVV